ncbi:hypothetical protein B9Z55_003696 [Caenorhabditis nigoni]|nr:hypothetical protein B9Z55_003696 [Caenorhabditis nigoni]
MEIENFCIGKTLDLKDVVNVMPLISQMNIIKEFECLTMLPPNSCYQLTTFPNCIRIYNSVWFDVSQLLNCTCTRIELGDSRLCNQDLNVFLQNWKKTKAFPNLQWLKVESKNMDNQSAILDIVPPIMSMENPRQQVSIQFGKNDYVIIYDAVRVYKEDGREAWLRVTLGSVPKLEFLVGNPDNTKVKEVDASDDEEE